MIIQEFSDQFDTLLNSYNIQAGFGEGSSKQGGITLDEYEKSVFLTQAQDNITKSYFDRTTNSSAQGFDDSTRRQVDFSSLIKVRHYSNKDTQNLVHDNDCYDSRGLVVTLSGNILFMLNEKLEVGYGADRKTYIVVPINYREYDREMSKAYGQPLKKQTWRLFSNNTTGYDIRSEIIPVYGSINTATTVSYRQSEPIDASAPEDGYEWQKIEESAVKDVKATVFSLDELPTPSASNEGTVYKIEESSVDDRLEYVVRYVERPTPIILQKLPNNLKIDGYDGSETFDSDSGKKIYTGNGFNCSLNPVLHMDILNEAFRLAVATRGGGTVQRQQNNNNNQ